MKFSVGMLAVISAVTAHQHPPWGCGISQSTALKVISEADSNLQWTLHNTSDILLFSAVKDENGDQAFRLGSAANSVLTFKTVKNDDGIGLRNSSGTFVRSSNPTKFELSCDKCDSLAGSRNVAVHGCTMAILDNNGSPDGRCLALINIGLGNAAAPAPCNGSDPNQKVAFAVV